MASVTQESVADPVDLTPQTSAPVHSNGSKEYGAEPRNGHA